MSNKLNKLLDERRELLNNIKTNEDLLQTTLIRVKNFDDKYINQNKLTYTGKKVTKDEILQNVEDIKTNIPMYRDLIELYKRQNEDLTPLIDKERQKINNATKKSEQKYSELRKGYIDHRVITDSLSSGLEELAQSVAANASASASSNPTSFMERLTQKFTGKKLPANVKIEGESSDDDLEDFSISAYVDANSKSSAGGKRKRKTNKRKYSNKRKKYSNKRKKRRASRKK